MMTRLRTHPGEVLRDEYLVPLGLSAHALAKELDVPANRLTEIMRGVRDVTADTAIRLSRYFGTDPRFWLNLQAAYDLSKAERPIATGRSCAARPPKEPLAFAPAHGTFATTARRLMP
jgi:antitoxin HigA-1